MKYVLAIIVLLLIYIWIGDAQGQESPKPAFPSATAPAGVTVSDAAYPLPPEDKAKVRDCQYESDQLEIQNQKLQAQLDQNRTRQAQLLFQEKTVVFEFATKRKINLDLYELDPAQVKLITKKKK